ncbi:MAG: lysostaphin resistance A-like protein [Paeniclostridium sp.]
MKKFLKSIGLCIGLIILNNLMIGVISFIFAAFAKNPNDFDQNLYILVFIGDLITLILVHLMFLGYDKKILSKELFKKISMQNIINIILFGIGCSVVLLILTGTLSRIFPEYESVANELQLASNSWISLIITIFLAPICEEILFRYVIFGYLKERYSLIIAIIGQALAFGLAHGNIVQGIYTFIVGIALALIYIYSGSLVGSIVLHITFNMCGTLIPELGAINPMMLYMVIILGIVCLVISIFRILKKYESFLYE